MEIKQIWSYFVKICLEHFLLNLKCIIMGWIQAISLKIYFHSIVCFFHANATYGAQHNNGILRLYWWILFSIIWLLLMKANFTISNISISKLLDVRYSSHRRMSGQCYKTEAAVFCLQLCNSCDLRIRIIFNSLQTHINELPFSSVCTDSKQGV